MIDLLTYTPWQMTFGERAALEGILGQLKPQLAIEIGTAEGGSLRRIAEHSRTVHSFDLVTPSLAPMDVGNIELHTGDSHALLPAFLSELDRDGDNVDFVLVDGDHSADGVEADLCDLLGSSAVSRTIIVIHDTLNDEVRHGIQRVTLDEHEKVAFWDLDFVGGHLSHGGDFHHQLWGGMGLVVVDSDGPRLAGPQQGRFYQLFELLAPMRNVLVAEERAGRPIQPGEVREVTAVGNREPASVADASSRESEELERARLDLANARVALIAVQSSQSWRLTAPLRWLKRLVLAARCFS